MSQLVHVTFLPARGNVSAGRAIIALPTILIYFLLQRHFVAGLIPSRHEGLSSKGP